MGLAGMMTVRGRFVGICGVLALSVMGCGDDAPPAQDGSSDGGSSTTTAVTTSADETASPTTAGTTEGDPDTTSGESTGPGEVEVFEGSCPDQVLPPRPADTAARGPWSVGVRTVDLNGLTVEVWYPATDPGDAEPVIYDVRDSLPESEQDKISDEDNPWQECDCYRDLPIDDASGPYPVVLFVHGTAGFRTQSLPHMEHWASRGFIVLAADHPGLWLADLLGIACGAGMVPQDLQGDLDTMLMAVRGEIPGLEDLGDRIDPERIATSGHSAGGNAVSSTGDYANVVIPMAAGGVEDGTALESTLVLGAMADSVVAFNSQVDGYEAASARKRLVGIANTGHLAFSEMCALSNAAGDSLLEIAQANDICGAGFAGALFQCDDEFIPDPDSWDIIHYASSAVLEETLHCEPEAAPQLGLIQGRYPFVLEFREEL